MNTPESSLQLRLVRSYGEQREAVFHIAAAGSGLASALELSGGKLTQAQWRSAERCRVEPAEGGWALVNESRSLVCTLNGERVPPGNLAPVAPGDRLELGLLRFEFEAATPDVAVISPGPAAEDHPEVAAPAEKSSAAPFFDLRDLAHVGDGFAPTAADEASLLDSPFGVLDIAGAQAATVGDSLEAMLADAPARRAAAVEEAIARVQPHVPSDPSSALLAALHEEFVRTVRDPGHLSGRTDWEGVNDSHQHAQAPTLDELSQQAAPYPLLRDILLPREHVDQLIEDFDPLRRSSLLDTPSGDDVLALFAPEIARNTALPVPSLTRREHHELSPDSYMPTGRGTGKPPQ